MPLWGGWMTCSSSESMVTSVSYSDSDTDVLGDLLDTGVDR